MDGEEEARAPRLAVDLASRGLEPGEPISVRRVIEAPSERLWELLSRPGHLERVHPFCRRHTVQRWPGRGSQDTILYHSGLELLRDFVAWIEGEGYDIEIGPPGHKTAYVIWRLHPRGAERCELHLDVVPYLEQRWTERRRRLYQEQLFGESMALYIENVVRGVDHAITTGEVVRPNQFGAHPAFSE